MTACHIIDTVEDMKAHSARVRAGGKTIGFVPTMGALHEGHLSLVRRAAADTDHVVVSVYVNPTQFAPTDDFDEYPRQLQADVDLAQAAGAGFVFAPSDRVMYPDGFCTYVVPGSVTENLCGLSRPGFFRGVATVCTKLFNCVRPHKAFFGQKDYQQSVVIRRLVADMNMDLDIVVCPTVREPDGLAMSSRNKYLSAQEREQALCLHEALTTAKGLADAGERGAAALIAAMRKIIEQRPLARIDYVSIVDPDTIEDVDVVEAGTVAVLAVFMGATRLIDNEIL